MLILSYYTTWLIKLTIIIVWVIVFCFATTERLCYQAKTCIHNGKEKCGRNGRNEVRKFFDTCDLLEYNCLRKNDYALVDSRFCHSLPPIDDGAEVKGMKDGLESDIHDQKDKSDIKDKNILSRFEPFWAKLISLQKEH